MRLDLIQAATKLLITLGVALLIPGASGATTTDEKQSLELLQGARTGWYVFSEFDDGICTYEKSLKQKAQPLIDEIAELGLKPIEREQISRDNLPDVTILVGVEAKATRESVSKNSCTIYVKVEVFHSMTGTLRYQVEPQPLRVLAYRTIWVDAAEADGIEKYLHQTALHALAKFGFTYLQANPNK
ncbi:MULTISPECIES: hypothetical protein [unclassified Acidovorax]|jgi:hypothetical protein|uniref:hypothetical protein n=1 Tax=unclassified Acidovorax TaxID=2684926 RepID=UPI000BD21C37|nr:MULTISPECIES: hypothetical protein [unclassified Acidovorax]OZA56195.1 MAG: hypothetical protein B7X79_11865 [Acidovorax sp. 17-64-282]HQS20578.1 hypothetical protein [Acidovorax defluvii]OYY29813.1 MAG: hypothetical protein B7Y64_00115 [Acidovorax sp. 35-64-16]OYY82635.1 MAG: hypothetical protein B7Y46_17915 [Acidovorax sp. 28-64-14]OYZ42872.1 MAG: hypothetical protein B7Y20_16680 [Acidovorax sp. 16-64-162]